MNTCRSRRKAYSLMGAALILVLWSLGPATADASGEGTPAAAPGSLSGVSAHESDTATPQPGVAEGTDTHFAITGGGYLDVTLDSSEMITVRLSSSPEMVIIQFSPSAEKASAMITLGGFRPSTTYYKYEDNYHNREAFTTDPSGAYAYTQDLSTAHRVFIQPRKSTKFISDTETGGDCASIGVWNSATRTCTLTMDLSETVQIDSDHITLDGNGHSITGAGTGFGVYVPGRVGVAVMRVNVTNFSEGISLYSSSSCTITGNTTSSNVGGPYWGGGIHLDSSSYNTVSGNTSVNNAECGISLSYSHNNTVAGNTLSGNAQGLRMDYSRANVLSGNTASSNGTGYLIGGSNNQLEQMNNLFENNSASNNSTGIALVGNYNTLRANDSSQNTIGLNVVRARQNILTDNVFQENRDFDVIFNWYVYSGGYTMMQGAADCTNTFVNTTGSGGRPIRYFNTAATVQNEVLAELILCKANGSTVSNITIAGSDTLNNNGMLVIATNNAVISNVTSADNRTGIYLSGSSFNAIQNSTVRNNEDGIRMSWSSTDNTVSSNTAEGNTRTGVYSHHGVNSNLAISDNGISGGMIGIACESPGASNTVISGNDVSNISSWGIEVYSENGNRIFNNTVRNSAQGLYLQNANNVQVYNNSFIDNTSPAGISGGTGNVFSLALPVGGNYWSSFDSPAEGCTDSNSDRICDAPYVLGAGAADNLPWTLQNGWLTFQVTPVAEPGGSIAPSSPQAVPYLQTTVFSIASFTGHHIASVTGCGGTLSGATYTTAPVTADCTVTATFAKNTYTVTPAAGPGGTIDPALPQTVQFMNTTSFQINPDGGYRIKSVTGCYGTLNGTTYTTGPVTADCSVNADFERIAYTLTVAKAGTGSGTVTSTPAGITCGGTCSASFTSGTSVLLTAATTTSTFDGWSGGGCSGTGTCTVVMNGDTAIMATFNRPSITVIAPNGGEIWSRGGTHTIRWNYTGNPGPNVRIELLKGGVPSSTITSSTPVGSNGSGSYAWKIPKSLKAASNYTVRVTSTASGITDTSNGNFTIK